MRIIDADKLKAEIQKQRAYLADEDKGAYTDTLALVDLAPTFEYKPTCVDDTLSFVHEYKRMCASFEEGCSDRCPFRFIPCSEVGDITQEHIDILQDWVDAHPEE